MNQPPLQVPARQDEYEDLPARPYPSSEGYACVQIDVHPSGRIFLTQDGDRIALRDLATGTLLVEHALNEIMDACFSPSGKVIAAGFMNRRVALFEPHTGKRIRQSDKFSDYAHRVHWLDERRILAASSACELFVLDAANLAIERTLLSRMSESFFDMVCAPGGNIAYFAFGTRVLAIDTFSGAPIWKNESHASPVSLALSPGGDLLAVARDNQIQLVRASDGLFVGAYTMRDRSGIRYPGMAGLATSWRPRPAFSPDGRRIATNTRTGSLVVLDASNAAPLLEAPRIPGLAWIEKIAWLADGNIIVGCSDNKMGVWRLEGPTLLRGMRFVGDAPQPSMLPAEIFAEQAPAVPAANPQTPSVRANTACAQCGAPRDAVLCRYCGAIAGDAQTFEAEREALDMLHDILLVCSKETQAKLLRGAFLPAQPGVLIEAGLRVSQLVHENDTDEEPAESAALRLRSIVSKLRTMPPSAEIARALPELDAKLASFARAHKSAAVIAVVMVVIVLAIIGFILWRIFR